MDRLNLKMNFQGISELEHHEIASAIASKSAYTVSGVLVLFGFTLNDIALILGMILGIATFFLNWYYKHKTLKIQLELQDDED